MTWMNLENMISKRNQAKKTTYGIIPFISNVRMGKSTETETKLVVTGSCGEEEWRVAVIGYGMSLWEDENVLEMRWWLHNIEIIELYTLKGLKREIPNFIANTKNIANTNLIDLGFVVVLTFTCSVNLIPSIGTHILSWLQQTSLCQWGCIN